LKVLKESLLQIFELRQRIIEPPELRFGQTQLGRYHLDGTQSQIATVHIADWPFGNLYILGILDNVAFDDDTFGKISSPFEGDDLAIDCSLVRESGIISREMSEGIGAII
jgi:hypothetical protein